MWPNGVFLSILVTCNATQQEVPQNVRGIHCSAHESVHSSAQIPHAEWPKPGLLNQGFGNISWAVFSPKNWERKKNKQRKTHKQMFTGLSRDFGGIFFMCFSPS